MQECPETVVTHAHLEVFTG